jgi:hypothetical protein
LLYPYYVAGNITRIMWLSLICGAKLLGQNIPERDIRLRATYLRG